MTYIYKVRPIDVRKKIMKKMLPWQCITKKRLLILRDNCAKFTNSLSFFIKVDFNAQIP